MRLGKFDRDRHTAGNRLVPVFDDDGVGVKPSRDLVCTVDLSEDCGNPANPLRRADLLRRHATPVDETSDEPALRLDERIHRRSNPNLRCPQACRVLGRAVDSQQVGVVSADPQHIRGAADVHPVIPIGDPPREGGDARRQPRPKPPGGGGGNVAIDPVHGG